MCLVFHLEFNDSENQLTDDFCFTCINMKSNGQLNPSFVSPKNFRFIRRLSSTLIKILKSRYSRILGRVTTRTLSHDSWSNGLGDNVEYEWLYSEHVQILNPQHIQAKPLLLLDNLEMGQKSTCISGIAFWPQPTRLNPSDLWVQPCKSIKHSSYFWSCNLQITFEHSFVNTRRKTWEHCEVPRGAFGGCWRVCLRKKGRDHYPVPFQKKYIDFTLHRDAISRPSRMVPSGHKSV